MLSNVYGLCSASSKQMSYSETNAVDLGLFIYQKPNTKKQYTDDKCYNET